MYKGYKFSKIEQIVLYAIAENRRPVLQEEIYRSLPEIDRRNIDSTFRKLEKQNLIKRGKRKKEKNIIILNTGKIAMSKIKKMLEKHWESNWEVDWNVATS